MKKILEVNEPLVKCYPHHASYLAGMQVNDFDIDMVINNYIQLVYNKDIARLDFNIGMDILWFIRNFPLVNSYCYDRKTVSKHWKKMSFFAKEMINKGYYIMLLVDSFYIKSYDSWYKKSHIIHNIMIYGYDETKLYVADCFDKGKYSFRHITYDELENSKLNETEYDWLSGIHCWEFYNDVFMGIGINVDETIKMLKAYIDSNECYAICKSEGDRRNDSFVYGLNIYDEMIDNVMERKLLDVRIPAVMANHKQALIFLLKRLHHISCIERYSEHYENLSFLLKSNIKLQNLYMKYNMKRDEKIKESIVKQINYNKTKEKELLKLLIMDIHKDAYVAIDKVVDSRDFNCLIDEKTHGNWLDKYGKKGFIVIGDRINLGGTYDFKLHNAIYVSVYRKVNDDRALRCFNNTGNVVAYYLNQEFSIQLIVPFKTKISLYFVDFDNLDRKMELRISNRTNTKKEKMYLENFKQGRYVVFETDEDVSVELKRIDGPDAVISGIFFD